MAIYPQAIPKGKSTFYHYVHSLLLTEEFVRLYYQSFDLYPFKHEGGGIGSASER